MIGSRVCHSFVLLRSSWVLSYFFLFYCKNGIECLFWGVFQLPKADSFSLSSQVSGFRARGAPRLTLPFETSSRGIFDQGVRVRVLCRGGKSKSSAWSESDCGRTGFSSSERRRPASGRRWIVGRHREPHRTSTSGAMGERRPRMRLSACAPRVSSIQWFLTRSEPICRWSRPWRRSERGIRWRVARGRRPSIWPRWGVATSISCSSFPCRELSKIRKQRN